MSSVIGAREGRFPYPALSVDTQWRYSCVCRYAFVKYMQPEVIDTVVAKMHGTLVAGHSVRVVR